MAAVNAKHGDKNVPWVLEWKDSGAKGGYRNRGHRLIYCMANVLPLIVL